MDNTKELILFVPGMGSNEPEEYLKKLIDGMREYCDGKGITFNSIDNNEVEQSGVRTIKVELDNQTREIEIREIFWSDLRPRLSNEGALRKLIRGLDLFFYWVSSLKTWMSASRSKYMFLNTVLTLFLFLIWYYGAVAAAFTAIGASPPEALVSIFPDGGTWFKETGDAMGSWKVWLFSAALMTIIPVSAVIDISFATKCYLQNRLAVQHKINGRLYKALNSVNRSPDSYSQVTLLCHSFGVVVATETIADFDQILPVQKLVTMGGPLELIQARSVRVRDSLKKMENELGNGNLKSWIDFYSDYDWLCSKTPVSENIESFKHHKITTTVPWDQRASGASHSMYFTDWDVMKELVRF